jgi:hypothetical protein
MYTQAQTGTQTNTTHLQAQLDCTHHKHVHSYTNTLTGNRPTLNYMHIHTRAHTHAQTHTYTGSREGSTQQQQRRGACAPGAEAFCNTGCRTHGQFSGVDTCASVCLCLCMGDGLRVDKGQDSKFTSHITRLLCVVQRCQWHM